MRKEALQIDYYPNRSMRKEALQIDYSPNRSMRKEALQIDYYPNRSMRKEALQIDYYPNRSMRKEALQIDYYPNRSMRKEALQIDYYPNRSRECSVGSATSYRFDGRGSLTDRGKKFLSTSPHSDQFPRAGLKDIEEWKSFTLPGHKLRTLDSATRSLSQSLYQLRYSGSTE
jgi:hypothetical protein